MDYIPFNSRNENHKYPFGAVENGESIRLRVILPRSVSCSGVELSFHADGGEEKKLPLSWLSMEGDDQEWWGIDFKAGPIGLLFYHFEYSTPFGVSKIMHDGSGLGSLNGGEHEWQLTVFDGNFKTPDWLKGGLIYQIFPDRFFSSGSNLHPIEGRVIRRDWGGEPQWRPDAGGRVRNNDFFGGDIRGVIEKLDYLSSLGVTCIYFNPIFESHSNHRYDTADYNRIDELLGDEDDLRELCKKAAELGISVILDGVFSHTGDDSVYFNKYGRYDSVGAFQSEKSPYFSWYKFDSFPDKYKCWWGFSTLPEVDEENDDYIDFIAGKNGVVRKWMSLGVRGWRLDVADELPDKFLYELRRTVKSVKSDALLLGEVWEDASNKFAYDKRRRYLLGGQLDSVMNYPFSEAIIDFARSGVADGFSQRLEPILENYPKCVIDVLMNHIGTHDTERAITALAGESCENRDRQWQSEHSLDKEAYSFGKKLLKLASLMQYTLPGVPSLYYGDEAGMQGYKDPFNRCCYPWGNEDEELLEWYRWLGRLRRGTKCLRDGEYVPVSETLSCVCYIRKNENDELLVIFNRNEHEIDYYLPAGWEKSECLLGKLSGCAVRVGAVSGAVLRRKHERLD